MSIVLMLRDLPPQERSRRIDELTKQEFKIPYSSKKTISRAVIYSWLKECTSTPTDPLGVLVHKERSDRDKFRTLTKEQKKALTRWRYDNLYRTVKRMREDLLEHDTTNKPMVPSESTIARFLKSIRMDRKTMLKRANPKTKTKVRLAYEAPYPQYLWVADTKGPNLQVQDPDNPGEVKLAKLVVFLDDNSRYVVAANYSFVENEMIIMSLFSRAISLYGVPDYLYTDLGGPYIGNSLDRAATLLGCKIIHTSPRDPEAKGKVEKCNQVFYMQLETELILREPAVTIEQANEYLAALISQDYHRSVHSSTGQMPEERFFNFPEHYRRFVSKNSLAMVFLSQTESHVGKTGQIHLNKLQYLVPDSDLYGSKVEVRYDLQELSKVYVWHKDKYRGEASIYLPENDYLKRQELMARLNDVPEITIPDISEVPLYGYLERKLAAHRLEVEELGLNEALSQLKTKKEEVKAALVQIFTPSSDSASIPVMQEEFGVDNFAYLLAVMLKRTFDAYERLTIHTVWRTYGPFEEVLVREAVASLWRDSHPVSDLAAYLEAIRMGVM